MCGDDPADFGGYGAAVLFGGSLEAGFGVFVKPYKHWLATFFRGRFNCHTPTFVIQKSYGQQLFAIKRNLLYYFDL
jgi:tRNA A37 threonylcarbamoyladenosine biosynthesis protein TsaE